MVLELKQLLVLILDNGSVVAQELGDFLGVVFLGIARDKHHQGPSLDIFGVEGLEVVEGEAADLLGDVGSTVALPA